MLVVAGFLFAALMAYAGRYGYHRDEMYFIVAGSHPAFGYPDQPPLVPLVAHLMHDIAAIALHVPAAFGAGGRGDGGRTGAIAREVGGGRGAQTIGAAVSAVSGVSLAIGHFVRTTTFDVLSTSLLGWLLVRAVLRHDPRSLIWAGLVVGIGFEFKPQVAFVAVVAMVSLAVVGPRWVFRAPELWIGVAIAVAIGAPYLLWQQRHGWPQLTVARNIGGDAEGGRVGFIPFQLVIVSPVLVPIWIAGLVTSWRNPTLRALRFVPVLFGLLAAAYLIGDGKAYYLASVYPTLIGIGAVPTVAWLGRGPRPHARQGIVVVAVVLAGLVSAVVALPILPERQLPGSASIGLNPDLGETVGWSQFVATINASWQALPAATRSHAAIVTENYGEAGAIDVLGRGGDCRVPSPATTASASGVTHARTRPRRSWWVMGDRPRSAPTSPAVESWHTSAIRCIWRTTSTASRSCSAPELTAPWSSRGRGAVSSRAQTPRHD